MREAPSSEDELVAALHEVGNALTVILGWLGEAQRALPGEPASDATRAALELCERRSRRAVALCRRAIGADTLIESSEPLTAIVREVVMALWPLVERQRGTSLDERVSPAASVAHAAHGSDLISILTNLVLNAVEALGPDSPERKIEIACDVRGGQLALRVSDTGSGIDEAVRARLFTPGATTKPTGAGVGLAHSKALAARRGGELALVESAPGKTVFELTWPIADAGRPPRLTVEETPHTLRKRDLRGLSIAVVDDDPGVVELLEMVLAARGARVTSFPRYEPFAEALASAASFQVVLLDASPLGDALEKTLQRLRTDHRELGLVLISGASDPGATLGRLGVTWIRKPFDIEEVVFVIQTLKRGEAR